MERYRWRLPGDRACPNEWKQLHTPRRRPRQEQSRVPTTAAVCGEARLKDGDEHGRHFKFDHLSGCKHLIPRYDVQDLGLILRPARVLSDGCFRYGSCLMCIRLYLVAGKVEF